MTAFAKTVSIALAALALRGERTHAQNTIATCDDLITAIDDTAAEGDFTLSAGISCNTAVTIPAGKTITISGGTGGKTVSLVSAFLATAQAIFENSGTLTLDNLNFIDETEQGDRAGGVRAITNKGTLTVTSCTFKGLNQKAEDYLAQGGVIYTESSSEVTISGSTFTSNVATTKGAAIFANGNDVLSVDSCSFNKNEAGLDADESGSGADIWANRNVELTVKNSNFTDSTAEYGGGAIECCGATITNCVFSGAEASYDDAHYGGALLVNRPGEETCQFPLTMTNTNFTGCSVDPNGAGGSVAIFDTEAEIVDCFFESSVGTAVLFQLSDPGAHQLKLESSLFNLNTEPSEMYSAGSTAQGTALVVQNTGEGDEAMGEFFNVFCYGNEPYDCEFVYDMAFPDHSGEFKCQICNLAGERQASGVDDDFLGGTERSVDSGSDGGNQGIIVGLALALGLTLVVIGALAVWKFRVRKNARRLMEDMGDGDL